jgi:tungstate transport system ATP-binding protein
MSALLKVTSLVKSFGDRRLLDIDSLTLDAGNVYALTGDNGSGKSTLLRILAGLESADALIFEFAGAKVNGAGYPASMRRDIIYVHQHPYLFNTSVEANIEYGLKMRGIDVATRKASAREAMAWAGLDRVALVPPKRLSGGEKQKVAIARAKVLNPRLLLVDEPTANLDRNAREQIVALLNATASATASANNCVVVACHDQEIIDLPHVVRLHLEDGKISRL